MNANEWGVVFYLATSFDMSNATGLTLVFTKPDGTPLIRTNPAVAVGQSTIITPAGTFQTNQYVIYTFAQGEVDQSGTWGVRLTYTDATPMQLISDPVTFQIYP